MVDLRQKIKSLTVRTGGRAPFTGEIWSGKTRPGIELAYNQYWRLMTLVCSGEFSPYPHVKSLMKPGATYHLVDAATGVDTPVTVLQGHTLFIFEFTWNFSQNARLKLILDGFFHVVGVLNPLNFDYGFSNYFIGTDIMDPNALTAHTLDFTITNLGSTPLEGTIGFLAIDTEIGSDPLPDKKEVHCKWCDATKSVPNETIEVTCDDCEKITRYYPIIRGGSLGKRRNV